MLTQSMLLGIPGVPSTQTDVTRLWIACQRCGAHFTVRDAAEYAQLEADKRARLCLRCR